MSESGAPKAKKGIGQAPWHRLAIDMGPILIFVLTYVAGGIYWATGAFMVAIVSAILFSWRTQGRVSVMLWVTGTVVMIFGGLTIFLQDPRFVKIKPTIVNGIFAGILAVGLMRRRSYLKLVLEAAFPPLDDAGWTKLTRNWALFFVAMAIVNEIVWRNFSTDFWVSFKLLGFVPLTLLFAMSQVPVIIKHQTGAKGSGETGGNGSAEDNAH